jgi:PAS domain S-box-containing protein
VLPVLFVSLYGIFVNVRAMERIALQNLSHDLRATRGRASNFLGNVESDILVLVHSAAAERYTRLVERGGPAEREAQVRHLAEEILAFSKTKGTYYQIRVVENSGQEVLRVESPDLLDPPAHFQIAPEGHLASSDLDYYFLLTKNLAPGEIAFSPVELGYGHLQQIPVLTFATPLVGPTKRTGLLIANVFAGELFNELESQRNLEMNEKVVLVGNDGHYLYNSSERGDWNRLIAQREEDNLQKDYPESISRAILSGTEGIITEGTSEIIAYAPLLTLRPPSLQRQPAPGFTKSLFVFEAVPRSSVTRDARSAAETFALFLLVFFSCAIALGLLATGQFTRPISELRSGAEIISRGNYRYRLNVDTGDEIETLARQFNAMASSLEQHEHEIEQHRTQLEEMVDHRTRELMDQKGKLQAILDNVPSAFVLLDRDCRIQTVSAAFTSITGLELRKVIGQDSRTVFRKEGFCKMSDETLESGTERIETHTDRTVDRAGTEQFLEHTTIPLKENGELGAILQIITNVTARKRLEEQLIHSEKLMATGEMAAIIAHGFRNSLTSIKMILQLQQESKRLGVVNRKSLRVALDSIGRMEMVVQELLNFARPSPMVFAMGDLNTLIEEGLALFSARLKLHRISLRKSLDQRIPPMALDGVHLREGMVNIVLNAMQAIEGQPSRKGRGQLTVSSARVVLTKTLRDYYTPEMTEASEGSPVAEGKELILRKGRECAAVRISDNGPGIDRATQRRIFDPFFTTKTNGTGLGLPMVKRTVNAHGGLITVTSSKKSGTTFEIVLPIHRSVV